MSHITVIGCGNIGSHLVSHLARLPQVASVTLIDKDQYEQKNIAGQEIEKSDVGRPKVQVQARRLRRINPGIRVEAICAPLETMPLAALRGDLILGCLDSRVARMHLNQSAWRLGVPWIDAGIDAGGMLARVNAYRPGVDQPCLECAWFDNDYRVLETSYPCLKNESFQPATNGPSGLGALTAGLQVIEAQKYLSGKLDQVLFGRQLLIDAANHKHYVTTLGRNPRCRFDHESWKIEKPNPRVMDHTLGDILGVATRVAPSDSSAWLCVERKPFAKKLFCPGCGHSRSILHLQCSLSTKVRTCTLCGQLMLVAGWDLAERLTGHLPKKTLSRSLRSLGLRSGDVVTIGGASGERHVEIRASGGAEIGLAA